MNKKRILWITVLCLSLFASCTKDTAANESPEPPDPPPPPAAVDNEKVAAIVVSTVVDIPTLPYSATSFSVYDTLGTRQWNVTFDKQIYPPVITNGKVVAVYEYELRGYDLKTGALLWSNSSNGYRLLNDVVSRNDTVICSTLYGTRAYVAAYSAIDGSLLFSTHIPAQSGYGFNKMAWHENAVYFTLYDGPYSTKFVKYNTQSKSIEWQQFQQTINVTDFGNAIVAGDLMVTVGGGSIGALNKHTGSVAWNKRGQFSRPFSENGRIIALDSSKILKSIDPVNGGMIQRWPVADNLGLSIWRYTIYNNKAYLYHIHNNSHYLTAFNLGENTQVWKTDVYPGGGLNIKYGGNKLFLYGSDGNGRNGFSIYNAATGVLQKHVDIEDRYMNSLSLIMSSGRIGY